MQLSKTPQFTDFIGQIPDLVVDEIQPGSLYQLIENCEHVHKLSLSIGLIH